MKTLTIALLSLSLPAQTNWFPVNPSSNAPPARISPAMASDPGLDITLLFGGGGASGPLGDTWAFDGSQWQQVVTASAPTPREGARMVYDWWRNVLVLYGGVTGTGANRTSLSDLWEYDGTDWTRVMTQIVPPARGHHGMVYDFLQSRVLVFGGTNEQGGTSTVLGDTWQWDGVTWQQLTTAIAPSPRASTGMVYRFQGQTFLFGGVGANGPLQDTWIFDGSNWIQQSTAVAPAAQAAANLSYDQQRDRCILLDANAATWEWNGSAWSQVATSAMPPTRADAGAEFDLSSGQVVLFGGADGSGNLLQDSWLYRATSPATALAFGTPCGAATLTISSSGLPWIGGQLFLLMFNVQPLTDVFLTLGVSATSWNGVPLPFDLSALGFIGCQLYTSPDFVDTVYSPNGIAATIYQMPSNPSLVGTSFFAQALARSPGANPAGYVTTNALELVIGGQ